MPIATPFYAIEQIAPEPLAGKLVIDANSYYPQHDSHSASEMLAKHLSGAKVVEALNAILERDARAVVASDRLALLIAGNDAVPRRSCPTCWIGWASTLSMRVACLRVGGSSAREPPIAYL